MEKNDGALLLFDECVPNELDSDCTGAMDCIGGGVGVAGGGGSPRSNQDGARARRSQGGVGGGVCRDGNGSCTRFRVLSELDDRWIGAGSVDGGVGRWKDPPVS